MGVSTFYTAFEILMLYCKHWCRVICQNTIHSLAIVNWILGKRHLAQWPNSYLGFLSFFFFFGLSCLTYFLGQYLLKRSSPPHHLTLLCKYSVSSKNLLLPESCCSSWQLWAAIRAPQGSWKAVWQKKAIDTLSTLQLYIPFQFFWLITPRLYWIDLNCKIKIT